MTLKEIRENHIFVINRKERADRMTAFKSRFSHTGLGGARVITAIDGHKQKPTGWWKAGAGAWGCYMSHLSVLMDAIREDLPHYLVFEDDVIFVDGFDALFSNFLSSIPPWDMIYLGGQHMYRGLEKGEGYPPHSITSYDGKPINPILRANAVTRTHAYMVNKRAYSDLLAHLMYTPDFGVSVNQTAPHIDHHFAKFHLKFDHNIYCPVEWLCGQTASPSDIGNNTDDKFREQWWPNKGWGKQIPEPDIQTENKRRDARIKAKAAANGD